MAQLKNTDINDVGNLTLPSGTSAQRPGSPTAGMIRFNTDLDNTEFYDGTAWRLIGDTFTEATGGTIVDYDVGGVPFRTHLFTNLGSSTFTVTRGGEIEYLIVAGGGGGGQNNAGGGGGGGLIMGKTTVSAQSYTIRVGAGGSGSSSGDGGDGGNSSAFGLIAIGGGGGTTYASNRVGRDGGSGGGAGGGGNGVRGGFALQPGSASGGFGNDGGLSVPISGEVAGGSGGGAGGVGENGFAHSASDTRIEGPRGGPGLSTDISGEIRFFAGGGAGGAGGIGGNGQGGIGGGGDNAPPARTSGENTHGFAHPGRTNSGGGGGGGDNNPGGSGGSGVVIVRYRRNQNIATPPNRTKISNLPNTSLKWTVSKQQRFTPDYTPKVLIWAESEGLNNTNGYRLTRVYIDGVEVVSGSTPRSLRITQLRETGLGYEYVTTRTYDAYGSSTQANAADDFLEDNFQTGDIMIMTTYDHINNHSIMTAELQRHFESRAGIDFTLQSNRDMHLLVAIKNHRRLFENYRTQGIPGFTTSIWCD